MFGIGTELLALPPEFIISLDILFDDPPHNAWGPLGGIVFEKIKGVCWFKALTLL
jgi:hypothetical protein